MIFYNIQHFGDWTWTPWLLRMLADPGNQVLLTYDGSEEDVARVAADVTRDAPALKRLDVERSLPVRWCGPSQVTMQIEALRRALRRDGWEFFVNLSGTCTPLRSQAEIRRTFLDARAEGLNAHITAFAARRPVVLPEEDPEAPVETRKRKRLVLRGNARLLDQFGEPGFFPQGNAHNRVFIRCGEPAEDRRVLEIARPDDDDIAFRQAYFAEFQHYCGRAWYTLHRSVCEALVAFFDSPRFADTERAFLTCFEPDESFLPTILLNGMCVPAEQVSLQNFRTHKGAQRKLDDQTFRDHLVDTPALFSRKVVHARAEDLRAFLEDRVAAR
ncbi:Core-2/I-Branching enzyme (plasmid) [Marinibacterium anthonyi]|nr:Core-2/I-Branching enzyme [Marinibacterium anthonyi]